MKFEIKNWATGGIIFSIEAETWKLAVEAAVKAKADLRYANLSYADLRYANLSSAVLGSANLSSADLSYADLSSADLSYADLSYANLRYANLSSAEEIPALCLAQTLIVPEGPFFGWKQCRDKVLVKLFIPSRARRSNSTGRKCRAEYVKVLEVIGAEVGISQFDKKMEYRKGKWVHCDKWNSDRWQECGGGIHFFITRIEAENYS